MWARKSTKTDKFIPNYCYRKLRSVNKFGQIPDKMFKGEHFFIFKSKETNSDAPWRRCSLYFVFLHFNIIPI